MKSSSKTTDRQIDLSQTIKAFFNSRIQPGYVQFLRDYGLARWSTSREFIDPFSLKLDQKIEKYYFQRKHVEKHIFMDPQLPGDQIILGKKASGKTTISLRAEGYFADQEYLPIRISLHDTRDFVSDEEFLEKATASPFTIPVFTRIIFSHFWAQFILEPNADRRFHTWFRKVHEWMVLLRQLYKLVPPLQPILADDFELMTWLTSGQLKEGSREIHADLSGLVQLLRFITGQVKDPLTGLVMTPYKKVIIFLDGTEILQEKSAYRLLQDFEQLIRYRLPELKFKLFIHEQFSHLVRSMDLVQSGRLFVYEMPEWESEDLEKLLFFRPLEPEDYIDIYKWFNPLGEKPDEAIEAATNNHWTQLFSPPSVWRQVPEKIIKAALLSNEHEDEYDAPFHLLRLTRGLLSVYAGCDPGLPRDHFDTQLVDGLIATYWALRKEGYHE